MHTNFCYSTTKQVLFKFQCNCSTLACNSFNLEKSQHAAIHHNMAILPWAFLPLRHVCNVGGGMHLEMHKIIVYHYFFCCFYKNHKFGSSSMQCHACAVIWILNVIFLNAFSSPVFLQMTGKEIANFCCTKKCKSIRCSSIINTLEKYKRIDTMIYRCALLYYDVFSE